MKLPVFDLHCDTAYALAEQKNLPREGLLCNSLHFDLQRASRYSAYAQCFACYTSPMLGGDPEVLFLRELEHIRREVAANSAFVAFARTAQQVIQNAEEGIISAILTLEGPAGIGYDPERLLELADLGFKISTLGWNESGPLTGSHATGEGLSDRGREYVRQAQKHGILIDVSHISDRGFYDILDITAAPVLATHSNSRSVYDCSRNLTDDMFRQICNTNGVAGINLFADFLGEKANSDTVCDHIFRFLELDPDGRHIALGGDLDGCDKLPDGIKGVQGYELLADRLFSRGLSVEMIKRIFWENALEVMDRCCM